jgi:hypothetical protein
VFERLISKARLLLFILLPAGRPLRGVDIGTGLEECEDCTGWWLLVDVTE